MPLTSTVQAALLKLRIRKRGTRDATPLLAAGVPVAAVARQALQPGGTTPGRALAGKPQLLEDEIARKLAEAERSGELRAAASWGRPMAVDDGWQRTPDALRMGFKILKDAGVLPVEVELINQRAALREQLQAAPEGPERRALLARLATLEQTLALRMEALRRHG